MLERHRQQLFSFLDILVFVLQFCAVDSLAFTRHFHCYCTYIFSLSHSSSHSSTSWPLCSSPLRDCIAQWGVVSHVECRYCQTLSALHAPSPFIEELSKHLHRFLVDTMEVLNVWRLCHDRTRVLPILSQVYQHLCQPPPTETLYCWTDRASSSHNSRFPTPKKFVSLASSGESPRTVETSEMANSSASRFLPGLKRVACFTLPPVHSRSADGTVLCQIVWRLLLPIHLSECSILCFHVREPRQAPGPVPSSVCGLRGYHSRTS